MKKLMPPFYFVILLIFSIALHFIFPIKKIIFPPYTYLGWILIIFGAILNLWVDRIFKKKKTTIKPNEIPNKLIKTGPFKIFSHPVYVGMALILLGVAILHGTIITFIPLLIFIIIIRAKFIPLEEGNLKKKFGKEYIEYKKKRIF